MREQGHLEETGQAKITPAYCLPSKHVLHTVGPIIEEGDDVPLPFAIMNYFFFLLPFEFSSSSNLNFSRALIANVLTSLKPMASQVLVLPPSLALLGQNFTLYS